MVETRKTIFTVEERLENARQRMSIFERIVKANLPNVDFGNLQAPTSAMRKNHPEVADRIDLILQLRIEIAELSSRNPDEATD